MERGKTIEKETHRIFNQVNENQMEQKMYTAFVTNEHGLACSIENVSHLEMGKDGQTVIFRLREGTAHEIVGMVPYSFIVSLETPATEQIFKGITPGTFEWALVKMKEGNALSCGSSEIFEFMGGTLSMRDDESLLSSVVSLEAEFIESNEWEVVGTEHDFTKPFKVAPFA